MSAEQEPARRWCADLGARRPAGPGDVRSLEMTTLRARDGHYTTSFCVAWCRMTRWYGAAGMASTLLCRMLGTPGCDSVSPKQVTKNTPTKNRRLCPVEFFVVCVALVTTTCSSSECQPDDEAETTSRVVALCGAKQGPQGFVAEQKPRQGFRSNVAGSTSASIYPAVDLSRVPTKKKAGRFRY